MGDGEFEFPFLPTEKGKYRVQVQKGGEDIDGSPVVLQINPAPLCVPFHTLLALFLLSPALASSSPSRSSSSLSRASSVFRPSMSAPNLPIPSILTLTPTPGPSRRSHDQDHPPFWQDAPQSPHPQHGRRAARVRLHRPQDRAGQGQPPGHSRGQGHRRLSSCSEL